MTVPVGNLFAGTAHKGQQGVFHQGEAPACFASPACLLGPGSWVLGPGSLDKTSSYVLLLHWGSPPAHQGPHPFVPSWPSTRRALCRFPPSPPHTIHSNCAEAAVVHSPARYCAVAPRRHSPARRLNRLPTNKNKYCRCLASSACCPLVPSLKPAE